MSTRIIVGLCAAISLYGTVWAQDAAPLPSPTVYRAEPGATPRPVPKQISGGILNGKAVSLPKPQYPAAARAERASGPVAVQVLIDEQGMVISAAAVSGHALLRDVAVEAARAAQFSPTFLSGQPVKVSGVITYNFVADTPAEERGILSEIPVKDRDKIWVLGLMFGFIQSADEKTIKSVGNEQQFYDIMRDISTDLPASMTQYKSALDKVNSRDSALRSEGAREFVTAIRKEFSREQSWQVDIGEQIGFLFAEIVRQKARYDETGTPFSEAPIRTYLSRISEMVNSAPLDFNPSIKTKFQRVTAFSEERDLTDVTKLRQLVEAIMPLFDEFQ